MSYGVFICPICGEENRSDAQVCKGCGADERTGFREDYYESQFAQDGLDLPDDSEPENGLESESKKGLQAAVAIVLIILLVAYFVF